MNIKKAITRVQETYAEACRRAGAFSAAPTKAQAQMILFTFGVLLLVGGLLTSAHAATAGSVKYNDVRLSASVNVILTAIEGTFGALVMVAAGIGAILSSAFGNYKAALSLLVVAVGSFILRSIISTFFNDTTLQD